MPRPLFNNKNRTTKYKPRVAGDVRQYQLVSSFGIGSIVDFARDTVIIGGVDNWDKNQNDRENWEDRKIYNENLQALTGAKYFLSPKTESGTRFGKSRDISSYIFPEILYCPKCKKLIHYKEALNVGKPNQCFLNDKDGGICKGRLVASRFVVCCENGHLEDFPYSWWVHRGGKCKSGKDTPRISMFNLAGRSDAESLFIKCEECGERRSMEGAFAEYAFAGDNGYSCSCNQPHLREKRHPDDSECDMPLKTRLRTASGVYFSVVYSALSIPPWSKQAVQIIEREYEALQYMNSDGIKNYLKKKASATISILQLLEAYEVVKAHKGTGIVRSEADVYFDEYKVLSKGIVENQDEYSAFSAVVPADFNKYFDSITIVDKLTVIQALKGFTRLKPWNGSGSENSEVSRRIVPLSAYKKEWFPAVKLNGEGIFFKFNEKMLGKWAKRINKRYDDMKNALDDSFYRSANPRYSSQYVVLHTFAHLLIKQIAGECGYGESSLREKIYSTFEDSDNIMNGVLIYLASSDADGSLGGLIDIAENADKLQSILENMLRKAQWCSADPLCISSKRQGFLSLNYAACHDCLLLPETSCEFRNVLLDRTAVVGTPEDVSIGLFGDCF
jgi:hypothetical protein